VTVLRFVEPAEEWGEVDVVVLHSGAAPELAAATDLANAIRGAARGKRVGVGAGFRIAEVRLHAYAARELEELLAEGRVRCVVIPGHLGGSVDEITRLTRRGKALSLAERSSAVEAGVTLGIVTEERRARIYVNLGAARAEGVRFLEPLLRRATRVDAD